MSTITELEHRDGVITVRDCELLGTGHIDYGSPRAFQVKIYRGLSYKSGNRIYIVQKIGLTTVPGEKTWYNCTIVRKIAAVIQVLHSLTKDKTRLYMPKASLMALEQASAVEPALWRAWQNYEG